VFPGTGGPIGKRATTLKRVQAPRGGLKGLYGGPQLLFVVIGEILAKGKAISIGKGGHLSIRPVPENYESALRRNPQDNEEEKGTYPLGMSPRAWISIHENKRLGSWKRGPE